MNAVAWCAVAVLAGFFCWAVWSGWQRPMGFVVWHAALFIAIFSGFGLGYFGRALWVFAKLFWSRG